MHDYTIGLALYDYLPGIFTGLGLYFIAQIIRRYAPAYRYMAYVGAALVVTAGLMKATWKLVMATSGQDIPLLSQSLFPMMGPGFLLFAVALWAATRGLRSKNVSSRPVLYTVLVIVIGVVLAIGLTVGTDNPRGWFPVFLMMASISNVAIASMLIREAWIRRRRLMAGLFFLNIAMVFALQPIAQMPEKSIAIHWFEQTLTTGGAAAFALAAYLLLRALSIGDVRSRVAEDVVIGAYDYDDLERGASLV